MNGYKLTQKLIKTRSNIHLSTIDQALFHELVAVCNVKKWESVFHVRTSELCNSLCLSNKTISKSRKKLAEAGLITFETCYDKKIGCYYSFEKVLSNDIIHESTPENCSGDKNTSLEESPVNNSTDNGFTPIICIKTIKEENITGQQNKDIPLKYPYKSKEFLTVWETLRNSPKWKIKMNNALQLSLNKLSKYPEEFAIYQMNRAIESNWVGVVFPGTDKDFEEWKRNGNNSKNSLSGERKSAGIKEFRF